MNRSTVPVRVLGVIPGADEDTSMWFARRQMATVGEHGVVAHSFFLRSRTSPWIIWREMRRLRQEIKSFAPDVVHANFGTMTAFVCALVSPVPVLITFHGQDLNPSPGVHWLRLRVSHVLSRIAARRATQIVCVSQRLRERISHIKDRVHVIPCGIDLDRFRPMSQHECRAKLGWGADEKVVVFNAGSDPIRKRIDLAQAALALVKQSIPNVRFHVFSGSTHPEDMPVFYGAADCLLVASDYEGSPMVVKEAMACDLPIVSVDVGDVIERLYGVDPSLVVDRDPAALAEGLIKVLRQSRRSNGSEKVRELSEVAVARKLASIYRLTAKPDLSEPNNKQGSLASAGVGA